MFIELLSEREKAAIDNLRKLGSDGGDFVPINYASCDYFLRFWDSEKEEIMSKVFGNQLILKKRVNTFIEEDSLHDEMWDLVHSANFQHIEHKIFQMLSENNALHNLFLSSENALTTSINDQLLVYMFTSDAFVDNKYMGSTLELKIPNNKIFKLVHGCKLMKAIGQLAKAAQVEKEFEEIRIRQSQIMNEAHISADLCISIHPLDYMTASYNNCDWSSCMNWEDGDYRRGVIEMMNSPYVIVAYLASSRTMTLENNFQWNSKRWREFFIVSDEGIFGIKGYPYWNREIEDITLKWLRELFSEANEETYSHNIITWKVNEAIIDPSLHIETNIAMHCGPAMYNDFYDNNKYHCILNKNVNDDGSCHNIYYSGVSECVCCAKDEKYFDSASYLDCEDCSETYSCMSCGDKIYYEEDLVEFNDHCYCASCFNSLPHCDCCRVPLDVDNFPESGLEFFVGANETNSKVCLSEESADDPLWKHVCKNCAENIFVDGAKELDNEHLHFSNWWYYSPIVPIQRISRPEKINITEQDIENLVKRLQEVET